MNEVKTPDYGKYRYERVFGEPRIVTNEGCIGDVTMASGAGETHAPVVLRSTLKNIPKEHRLRLLKAMLDDGVSIEYYPSLQELAKEIK